MRLDNNGLGEGLYSCYSEDKIAITARFKALKEITRCLFHIIIQDEDNIVLYANSMDFGGNEFNLQKGHHRLKIEFSLPIKQGKYNVEFGLTSAGKMIDVWKTTTKLSILDTYDHHDHLVKGILNITTRFSCQEEPSLISSTQ